MRGRTLVSKTKLPLTTATPSELTRTHRLLARVRQKLFDYREHEFRQGTQLSGGFVVVNAMFDFARCRAMDPGGIMLLWRLYAEAYRSGIGLTLLGTRENIAYVRENFDYFLASDEERRAAPRDGTYRLRFVWSEEDMIGQLNEWADSVRAGAPNVDEERVAEWQYLIGEATTNVFQHAGDARGIIVAGQTYPSLKKVQLAAFDDGRGIPATIRPVLKERGCQDGVCIKRACANGVTSQCVVENQGRGLATLVDMVHRNGGTMILCSGSGLVHTKHQRLYCRNKLEPGVPGTLLVLNLNLDQV